MRDCFKYLCVDLNSSKTSSVLKCVCFSTVAAIYNIFYFSLSLPSLSISVSLYLALWWPNLSLTHRHTDIHWHTDRDTQTPCPTCKLPAANSDDSLVELSRTEVPQPLAEAAYPIVIGYRLLGGRVWVSAARLRPLFYRVAVLSVFTRPLVDTPVGLVVETRGCHFRQLSGHATSWVGRSSSL